MMAGVGGLGGPFWRTDPIGASHRRSGSGGQVAHDCYKHAENTLVVLPVGLANAVQVFEQEVVLRWELGRECCAYVREQGHDKAQTLGAESQVLGVDLLETSGGVDGASFDNEIRGTSVEEVEQVHHSLNEPQQHANETEKRGRDESMCN